LIQHRSAALWMYCLFFKGVPKIRVCHHGLGHDFSPDVERSLSYRYINDRGSFFVALNH